MRERRSERERSNVSVIRGKAALGDGQDLDEMVAWSRHHSGGYSTDKAGAKRTA